MDSTTKSQEGEGRGRPPWWEEGECTSSVQPSPLAPLWAALWHSPTLGMTNLPWDAQHAILTQASQEIMSLA